MYVDNKEPVEKHNIYWALVKDLIEAAPSTAQSICPKSAAL